jgi:hypothetical protein
MDNRSSPEISSFVLRFVHENPTKSAEAPAFRGFIRHIQSDQELAFTRWLDALDFMNQFIPGEVFRTPVMPNQSSDSCDEPD